MTEDSNSAVSNSFLLDDDSRYEQRLQRICSYPSVTFCSLNLDILLVEFPSLSVSDRSASTCRVARPELFDRNKGTNSEPLGVVVQYPVLCR
jgi:hypothetical protein